MDTAAVRAAFDAQLRLDPPLDLDGDRVERTAHTVRYRTPQGWHAVVHSDLTGAADPDAVIAGEVAAGISEWKHYDGDRPADLTRRLHAAGLRAEEAETVMVAPVDEVATGSGAVRVVAGDLDRMAAVRRAVFGDLGGLGSNDERLAAGMRTGQTVVVVAVVDGVDVSAARLEFHPGREFAGLWGGGTLPGYRGRGVYRALVAHRTELAARRGVRYVYADCLPTSEPILARCGFHRLASTTPYVP